MNAVELYSAWAPEGLPWSPWAKPVLFADERPVPAAAAEAWRTARERSRGRWTPPSTRDAALVLDLPGPDALALALDCVAHGFRPVPLFNSCTGPAALVDNEPLRAGLVDGAELLRGLALPFEPPPVFVLDARRLAGQPEPARFDNRWIVFPQDFPSGALLRSRGIRRAVLVQEGRRDPASDLAHVLLRWQEAGVEILAVDLTRESAATPITVSRPGRFRALGYRVLAAFGLRRNSAGGFGAVVPTSASGGGGFFA